MEWPSSFDELRSEQGRLGALAPPDWIPPEGPCAVGGCFFCSPRHTSGAGAAGDRSWAGAALIDAGGSVSHAFVEGVAAAPYRAGLLALREGALLEGALRRLPALPDVLLVNATGRDHPRRAGLALHLGAVLDLPTVGVTNRVLTAEGAWPGPALWERSPLLVGGERVGFWLRTGEAARPLAIHAGWRTDPETAVAVVRLAVRGSARTPTPLQQARRIARQARAVAEGRWRWPKGEPPRPEGDLEGS